MSDYRENTRRIAKNTLMLYIRMLFMMFLGLFTSRIVLDALGETDYGIYNVVGGVVTMFTIISGSLTTAITRFITFEMGKGQSAQLGKVYSTAVSVQLLIALIVVLLAEPAGLWFIDNKMTIPFDRIPAARMVLHFSLLAFVINLMSVPQMASITAHEQMSVYAYLGVLEGTLRFAVALIISFTSDDRLTVYAALMAGVMLIVRFSYGLYCRLHFPECRYRPVFDRKLIREMFSFAGWNFLGVASGVLRDQGGNILVNLFSGPAVNAARAVAFQLNGAVQNFVTNFMTAVNPQITKSYASGDHDYMHSLLRKSSRMSFYLLFVLSLPVLFNTDFVLSLWLKEVPDYAASFVRLFIIYALCESVSHPLITAVMATGRIRKYQMIIGGLIFMNLPVSYFFLKMGAPPEVTVVVSIAISQLCLAARLFILKDLIGFSVKDFLTRIYFNVLRVALIGASVSYLIVACLPSGVLYSCVAVVLTVVSAAISCLFAGCSAQERTMLYSMLADRIRFRR